MKELSSLVPLFRHADEILVARKKKLASQPGNPIACNYCSFWTSTFTKKYGVWRF